MHDGAVVLAEAGWRSRRNQTVELAPAVANMLRQSGATVADLTGIAIAIGPGSYTGLRVGVGLVKGLSLANQLPLVGVPTLDILAAALPAADAPLVPIVEAGRSRVCAGFYEWRAVARQPAGWQAAGPPAIYSWRELLDAVSPGAVLAGEISPPAAKQIRENGKGLTLAPAVTALRRAGYLADLGWRRLRRGQSDDAASLTPIYLREPGG